MIRRRLSPDFIAIIALIALWLLFFWRLFTPVQADQASLKQGDFSGQFIAFAGYQYARFAEGEIPLWNPYNNGGLPFIADTQAAVFYPPRLITIALANLSGGWTYHALELEMTAHVLAYTLFMYAFIRRLTIKHPGSIFGAFVAAVITGYSGFTAGYPALQLALLEAAIWTPLALLGILEATRDKFRPARLMLTGAALGLSWLAGHPQTSFFITYLLVAYWGYFVYIRKWAFTHWIIGAAIFGIIGAGLSAVQLIPGIEYLTYTTRSGFGYDAKANGFPIQDIVQFIFPSIVSLYSPLFIGFTGLVLALIALSRKLDQTRFWGIVALVALLWSFGANSPVFPALYNLVPGLRFFRGQERAAFLVMNSLAILAGLGAAHLWTWDAARDYASALRVRVWLNRIFTATLVIAALIFVSWLGNSSAYSAVISPIAFSVMTIGVISIVLPALLMRNQPNLLWILALVLAFELFTVSMDAPSTYDPIPASQQISMTPPPLLDQVRADPDLAFRVDGSRGLTANYGSLYQIADIRGISPLFLNSAWTLIEGDGETALPTELRWELFAVRYVFTDWNELTIPSVIIDSGSDVFGEVNVHRLENPRPFALIQYRYLPAPDDATAYRMIADLGFEIRNLVILDRDPNVQQSETAPAPAHITVFEPERIVIEAAAESVAILSVSLVHYPGWSATVNGQPTEIMRAYGGLSALVIPRGDSTVELVYNPLTYRIGAVLSIMTVSVLVAVAIFVVLRRRT